LCIANFTTHPHHVFETYHTSGQAALEARITYSPLLSIDVD